MRTDSTGQRNKRQIAVSISWTHREPRGLVGSTLWCRIQRYPVRVPPWSKAISVSLFFFFSECGQRKFQCLSHVWRWLPHMRTSEVYSNLPAGYGFTNLWPKYVLQLASNQALPALHILLASNQALPALDTSHATCCYWRRLLGKGPGVY